jgi:UDP:flavonoid glycosyltransferase YjiC (YdhE family)
MRITILALGSRGDVQPFVPLGRGLVDAGHRVRVATFEAFAPLIQEAGLDFYPIHGDAQALLQAAAEGDLLTRRTNPIQAMRALRRSYGTLAHSLPRDCRRTCSAATWPSTWAFRGPSFRSSP